MSDHEDGKIECRICGARTHMMQQHLKEAHPELSVEEYRTTYPDADILSERAKQLIAQREVARVASASPVTEAKAEIAEQLPGGFSYSTGHFHELFSLGRTPAALTKIGNPIPVMVFNAPSDLVEFVPDIDLNYIWPIDALKRGLMALEMNMTGYFWGHAGTGKSSLWEQICAVTKRPMLRVQHSRNTEESHLVGQYIVRDSQTVFELGPLAFCMKYGLTFLADEYDFAMPSVLAVYQSVLEGKSLVIKEADAANRVIRPHPLFRIVGTGNTNGTGDETGLYQGTMVQNAANYERWAIVEEIRYMDEAAEINVVTNQGGVKVENATQLVKFAKMIREGFSNNKIGLPISPRALINAAKIGKRFGNLGIGLNLAYINRLTRVDQEVARETLRRAGI